MDAIKRRGISLMVLLAVALLGLIFSPAPASAQPSVYMYVPGVPGSSTDPQHMGWINVASLGQTWRVGANSAVCEVEVLKGIDAAGPLLWAQALKGMTIAEVRIEVMMPRSGVATKVYEYRLKNAAVTSITAATATTFAESVKLVGSSIELVVYPVKDSGIAAPPVSTRWNCLTNSPY